MTIPDPDRYKLVRDRLRNLGLHDDLLEQLAGCGPDVGLPIATELVERSSKDVIRRINAAYRRVSLALAQARGTATGTPSSPDAEPL